MKKAMKKVLTAFLALAMSLLICQPCFASGSTPTKMLETARKGVFRVYAFPVNDNGGCSGTCFAVGEVGEETQYFVTNWHVVTCSGEYDPDDMDIYIAYGDEAYATYSISYELSDGSSLPIELNGSLDLDSMIPCEIVDSGSEYPDVAIIKAEEPVPGSSALPLLSARDDSVEVPDAVYTLGYPGSADQTNSEVISSERFMGETGTDEESLNEFNAEAKAAIEEYGYTLTGVTYYKCYDYVSPDKASLGTGQINSMGELSVFGKTMCIQHNAHINHGSSGGPLLNEDGAVIGINTYGYGDTDSMEYSVSIYIDYAMQMLQENGVPYETYTNNTPVYIILGVVVAILILLVVIVIVVLRGNKKKKEVQQKASTVVVQFNAGVFNGQSFNVSEKMRIGRDPVNNDLVFPSGTKGVSGRHCVVLVQNGQAFIEDLNSSYGTKVNGTSIAPNRITPVQKGATVQLGSENQSFIIM